jgi:hypothetical protein
VKAAIFHITVQSAKACGRAKQHHALPVLERGPAAPSAVSKPLPAMLSTDQGGKAAEEREVRGTVAGGGAIW